MKKLILTTFLIVFTLSCFGQSWHQMISKGETDFRKIQKAFYKEWKDKPIERGNGYKLFKRWEHFNTTRLDNKGRISNVSRNYFIKKELEETKGLAFRSEEEANPWRSLGLMNWVNAPRGYNPGNGRINCIVALPDELNTIFIGAPVGGIWKKTNAAEGWTILSEDLTNVGITDIYVDPNDTEIIYVLTGDAYGTHTHSIGVLKSTNGGQTWEETGLRHEGYSEIFYFKMEVLPSKKNIMLVAGNTGIERSVDFGDTWGNVLDSEDFSDLIVHPVYDSIIYASGRNSSATEVSFYKSSDWGATWRDLSIAATETEQIGRTAMAVSIDEPDYVYLLGADKSGGYGGLFKSQDSGETFELVSDSPNILNSNTRNTGGQGYYDLALTVNPDNSDEVYVGGFHIYKSIDGGKNFEKVNNWVYTDNSLPYVHADIHTLDFYNGALYAGCDGGIFQTINFGGDWTDLSNGLDITQFYRIGLDPNDENIIIGGTQDNGSNIYKDGQWHHIYGADGMEAIVDHTDSDIVYQSIQRGGINKFTDKGNVFLGQIAGSGITETGGWITPYSMDPVDHRTLYAGYSDVWKTSDGGDNWEKISDFRSTILLVDLQVARSNPEYIYVTNGANLLVTKDGGNNWLSISSGLPMERISRIAISENNPKLVWVTLGGLTDGEKVYQSKDAGTRWENISSGLPNVPANCIIHQRDSEDQLYLGTDIGVFQKKLTDDSWIFFSAGLPGVIIRELEIHYASRKIRAATFGRGIWETEILNSDVEPLVIKQITPDLTVIQEGEAVNFSVEVDGIARDYFWEFEGGVPATSVSETPFAFYTKSGEFDVKLTINGILENKKITLENLISVNKVLSVDESGTFFSVYPNPATNELSVKFESIMDQFTYQLINAEGKVVLDKKNENPVSSIQLDLKGIDKGIYFLKVQSEQTQLTKKIIIAE